MATNKIEQELKFEGNLLEQLGFKNCKFCLNDYKKTVEVDFYDIDYIDNELKKNAYSSNIKVLQELGIYQVGEDGVKKVQNNILDTHALIFPLRDPKTGVITSHFKFAKIRSYAKKDKLEYRVYLGELNEDFLDKDGNLILKKGSKDFYAE